MRKDNFGRAPVHVAGDKGDAEIFRDLLRRGADPNMPDVKGNTVLHYLCAGPLKEAHFSLLKELFD